MKTTALKGTYMSLKSKLEALENALAWPITIYYLALVSFISITAWVTGCSDSYEDDGQGQYKAYELPESTPEPTPSPTPETFKLWTLEEIKWARYDCWDDFYKFVGEEYQMFCMCFVEKVSLRWERDDFLRHQYQYYQHLSKTGAMQRCTKLPEFWTDPTGELEADKGYDPEADTSVNGVPQPNSEDTDVGEMLKATPEPKK